MIHTNLVLIPKKEKVKTFGYLRLISLSNFVNTILSGLIHESFVKFLLGIISTNQTGFMKGRSI